MDRIAVAGVGFGKGHGGGQDCAICIGRASRSDDQVNCSREPRERRNRKGCRAGLPRSGDCDTVDVCG